MNKYTYEELEIGMKESYQVVITEKMMNSFCEVTGDINPLHQNDEYAKRMGYTGRVAYGLLTASFLSTMAGVYLPGERSLIHSVNCDFLKPIYIGENINIEGSVVGRNDLYRYLDLKIVMTNQNHEKVCKAKMRVGVLNDE